MAAPPLTARMIDGVPPSDKRREVPDGLLPGLYLVVQQSGAKSWAVRYRIDRRPRKMTLGPYPRLSLAMAREAAREALRQVAEGKDPSGTAAAPEPPMAQRSLTFAELVESFLERHVRPRNRASTAKETERLLRRNVLPTWKGRDPASITRADVIDLLDRLVDGGAAITANRTLAALSKLFNWAMDRGVLDQSPCVRVTKPGVERSRDRVLSDDELQAIWKAAGELGWPFGTFVQLLALTGQRRNEVAGMRWSEIDLATAVWTIPASRTKNGRVHDVPLSDSAVRLLKGVPAIRGEFILTTTHRGPISGFAKAKQQIDAIVVAERGQPIPAWTFHDLRRTMASGMARLGIALPVIEKVLNHASGSFSGVVGVYQRHDYAAEKREALDLWSSQIGGGNSSG